MIDSRTAMNRPDHQLCPIAPRVLRAFSPPSTGSGRDDSDHHGLFMLSASLAGARPGASLASGGVSSAPGHRNAPPGGPYTAFGPAPAAFGLASAETGRYSPTASSDSANTLRRSAVDSSVSQPSPSLITRLASAFLSSIISSIFSSRVPVQMNLR